MKLHMENFNNKCHIPLLSSPVPSSLGFWKSHSASGGPSVLQHASGGPDKNWKRGAEEKITLVMQKTATMAHTFPLLTVPSSLVFQKSHLASGGVDVVPCFCGPDKDLKRGAEGKIKLVMQKISNNAT